MPQMLPIHLDGDGCWPDVTKLREEGRLIDLMGSDTGPVLELAALPAGTVSGKASVTVRVNLPDGRVVLTEVTLRLLKLAVDAIATRYGV